MLLDKLNESQYDCTGCALCANICPVSAIEMVCDEDGFAMPFIDAEKCVNCKKCEISCPQLNFKTNNFSEPLCYAVKASDDILDVSSSGGAFSMIADYVFSKGGYVCGAAYDDDFMGVSHIMISDKADMYKLRGSKYVYSKPGNIYQQVRDKLSDDDYVLFSGTPCQVAALKSFLGKDHQKLITVDLLCGGLPPENLFKEHVTNVAKGRKISNISFRSKKFGWGITGMNFEFENGEEYFSLYPAKDKYFKGYLKFLYVRNSCDYCKYAPTPRAADLTIGDFWSYDKLDETVDIQKGISCILLNNENGTSIFKEIMNNFNFVKKMPLSFLRRYNRMNVKRKPVLAKKRFFDLKKQGWSFNKAVDYSLNWKYDVAISGCWTVENYGGELTYYALYNTIKDMGNTVLMVERRADIPGYDVPVATQFGVNPYPFYDVCRVHKSFDDQVELNARVKTFVIGSDQVWNYALMNPDSIMSWSFDYAKNYRRKISYASSFGSSQFNGNPEQKEEFSQLLQSFNAVSVRENAGVDICKDMGVDAVQVMDPVFLCDKKYFDILIDRATCRTAENYICTYFIHPNESKFGVENICDELKLGHIGTITCGRDTLTKRGFSPKKWPYTFEEHLTVESWLKYLTGSKLIVTDSFHATCLAIIYNIPFVFVRGFLKVTSGMDRLGTILSITGLENRVVDTVNDAFESKIYNQPIDWDYVNKNIRVETERSRNWLMEALESEIV